MRLPPLTAVRAFEAVGRLGSVREAGAELNVTPAAVNHQIRTLEEFVGVALFEGGSRGRRLTPAGEEFLNATLEAFELLHRGAERLARRAGVDRLVVNSLPSFAANFLVPRLGRFHRQNPSVQIEVNTDGRFGEALDFRSLHADVAIRGGLDEGAFHGLVAERLTPEVMFPVCAPELLNGPHPIRTPEDLAHHDLIIVPRTPEGWPDWIARARQDGWRLDQVDPAHGLRFDTIQLAMTAAVQGMGVVIGRRPLVDHYLESGQLVAPFDIEVTSRIAYWLVYPPTLNDALPLQAFRVWLRAELGLPEDTPGDPAGGHGRETMERQFT